MLPDDGRSISRNVTSWNILVHDVINLLYHVICLLLVLTHFSPVSHFYTPWERQKIFGFLTFSGSIEMWRWTKMGWWKNWRCKGYYILNGVTQREINMRCLRFHLKAKIIDANKNTFFSKPWFLKVWSKYFCFELSNWLETFRESLFGYHRGPELLNYRIWCLISKSQDMVDTRCYIGPTFAQNIVFVKTLEV